MHELEYNVRRTRHLNRIKEFRKIGMPRFCLENEQILLAGIRASRYNPSNLPHIHMMAQQLTETMLSQ